MGKLPSSIALVIYLRFSSDMQRPESCDDQERVIRRGRDLRGIDHSQALVIRDEAESGTKENRSGYDEIVKRIERGEQILLAVDDQSRLSRGDTITALIRDLIYHGGRFLALGEGLDTDQPGWDVRVAFSGAHNSLAIADIGRRVRRGQEGRILDHLGSAGDYCFGYRSRFVDPHWQEHDRRGPKPKKEVVIFQNDAIWVRQIFRWFVNEHWSIGKIARELTRRDVPKSHRSTKPGWYPKLVREILSNSKYIGLWIWGKTKTIRDSRGHKKQVAVPERE